MSTLKVSEAPDTATAGVLYARQSSGLVRDISSTSSVALNISALSWPAAALVATVAPSSFPGASPFWVILISGLLCFFPVLLYSLFTAIMPRAGGDYVFGSRTISPWFGFVINANFTLWGLFGAAYLAYLLVPFVISPAFAAIGGIAGSATLTRWATEVATEGWGFGIGATVLVLAAVLMSLPLRRAMKIYRVFFFLSLVALPIGFVLLLINGRADFQAAVTEFGGSYEGIIGAAHKAGYSGGGTFDFGNTMLALPLAAGAFLFTVVSSYVGGEIRSPKSSGSKAIVFSLLGAIVVLSTLMGLASHTFGNDFLGSAATLSNVGDPGYTLAAPASFFFFVSILSGSTVVATIINVSFFFAMVLVIPAIMLVSTRSLFAWSFDRIIPAKISEVNDRTRSPLNAMAIVLVCCIGLLALIVFRGGDLLSLYYSALVGQLVTFIGVAIAGIVFPYRRRKLYEESPVGGSILGVPRMTIISVIALAVLSFFFYSLLTADALGANQWVGLRAVLFFVGIGIVGYPIAKLINRKRGVDLNLAFKELPPE